MVHLRETLIPRVLRAATDSPVDLVQGVAVDQETVPVGVAAPVLAVPPVEAGVVPKVVGDRIVLVVAVDQEAVRVQGAARAQEAVRVENEENSNVNLLTLANINQ